MIRITMNGRGALVAPAQYLGGLFNTYVGVCREIGAKFDKAENANRISVERVPELVEALSRVGLATHVDDDVRAALQSHRATADAETKDAEARATAIDSALRAAGGELYKYQQDGVRWLAPRAAAGLFDQMGLGKTIQALVAAPAGAPILVVCPKNAKGVWLREAAKWRPELRAVVLSGRGSFRWPKQFADGCDCDSCLRLFHDKERLQGNQQRENVGAPMQTPVPLRLPVRDGATVPSSASTRAHVSAEPHNPSHERLVSIGDRHHPPGARNAGPHDGDATDIAFPVNDAGQVRKIGRRSGDAVRRRDHSANGDGEPMATERSSQGGAVANPEIPRDSDVRIPADDSRMRSQKNLAVDFQETRHVAEIAIINYDVLPESFEPPPSGIVLIADECHKLKNPKAVRTTRFRALSGGVRSAEGRITGLSGTPLLNRPPELWSVLQCFDLATEAFGSWNRFVQLMGGRKGRFGMEWSGYVDPQVPELLRRVSLMRRREEVLPDLPTKTYETVEFECVPQDLRLICDEIVAAIRKRGLDLEDAIAEAIETQGGVVFEAVSRVRSRLAAAKIPALLEWLEQFEEAEEPLVLFSRHRAPIDAIATRPGWGTITGDQTAEQRSRVEEAFQAGRLRGVCATIQAGCEALTLTRACRVVFVDLDWTPALNQQAEDRVCRIGQTRGVIVTRIIADHELDARVIELLGKKQSLIEQSVEASAVVTPATMPRVELPPARGNAETRPVALQVDGMLIDNLMPKPNGSPRRNAQTATEEWAARAIATLAGCDGDRAQEKNDIGFNRIDGEIGHSLADQMHRGLTDKQWSVAVKIAQRYPRQVGRPEHDAEGD